MTHALLTAFASANLGGVPLHVFASLDTGALLRLASPLASSAPKGGDTFPPPRRLAENDRNVKDHRFRFLVTHALLTAFASINPGGVPLHVFASLDTGALLRSASPLASSAPKGGGTFPPPRRLADESELRNCLANLAHTFNFFYGPDAACAFTALGIAVTDSLCANNAWFGLPETESILAAVLANFPTATSTAISVAVTLAASVLSLVSRCGRGHDDTFLFARANPQVFNYWWGILQTSAASLNLPEAYFTWESPGSR